MLSQHWSAPVEQLSAPDGDGAGSAAANAAEATARMVEAILTNIISVCLFFSWYSLDEIVEKVESG